MKGVNWLGCTAHTLQLVIGKRMKLAEVLIARYWEITLLLI